MQHPFENPGLSESPTIDSKVESAYSHTCARRDPVGKIGIHDRGPGSAAGNYPDTKAARAWIQSTVPPESEDMTLGLPPPQFRRAALEWAARPHGLAASPEGSKNH